MVRMIKFLVLASIISLSLHCCIKSDTSPLSYTSTIWIDNDTNRPVTVTTNFPKKISEAKPDVPISYQVYPSSIQDESSIVFSDTLLAYSKEEFANYLVSAFTDPYITISDNDTIIFYENLTERCDFFEEVINEHRAPFQKRPYVTSTFYIKLSNYIDNKN
jgi:hypothetical protein